MMITMLFSRSSSFILFVGDITKALVGKVCIFANDTKGCNRIDITGRVCNMEYDMALLEISQSSGNYGSM